MGPGIPFETIPCYDPAYVAEKTSEFTEAYDREKSVFGPIKMLRHDLWRCDPRDEHRMVDLLTAFTVCLMIVKGSE